MHTTTTASLLDQLLDKVEAKAPKHALKLRKYLAEAGTGHHALAQRFYARYAAYLQTQGQTLDFGVDCYLRLCDDMFDERVKFATTGQYSSRSSVEVDQRVYGNPEIMTYHMHGLLLAQFLWFEQVERIGFFCDRLPAHAAVPGGRYLEIGGGHGLYMMSARELLPGFGRFDLVDISPSSLQLARGVLDDDRVQFILKNILDFTDADTFDFVTMGEVLEHVEEPLVLLRKIRRLLGSSGRAFITTPVNSPMIDHIYLFNDEAEIRALFAEAGLEVVEERVVISEKMPEGRARKLKAPIMYAAFLRPAA